MTTTGSGASMPDVRGSHFFFVHRYIMPAFRLGGSLSLWCVILCFGEVPGLRCRSKTRSHLEYLHLQILSVVSAAQLKRIFERRGNFDLRRLLNGSSLVFLLLRIISLIRNIRGGKCLAYSFAQIGNRICDDIIIASLLAT
jgi:hypothetical protein